MTETVQSVIQNAIDRKRVPSFDQHSIRDMALKLGISDAPLSLRKLMRALNELVPAGRMYDTGRFAAGYVHASAQVYLQSDGAIMFSGQAHESGVVGDHFTIAIALLDLKMIQASQWPLYTPIHWLGN